VWLSFLKNFMIKKKCEPIMNCEICMKYSCAAFTHSSWIRGPYCYFISIHIHHLPFWSAIGKWECMSFFMSLRKWRLSENSSVLFAD